MKHQTHQSHSRLFKTYQNQSKSIKSLKIFQNLSKPIKFPSKPFQNHFKTIFKTIQNPSKSIKSKPFRALLGQVPAEQQRAQEAAAAQSQAAQLQAKAQLAQLPETNASGYIWLSWQGTQNEPAVKNMQLTSVNIS